MSRDHRKLRVFVLADCLVLKIYAISQNLPATERFGLQFQMRRAAVSVASNIVEGCARHSTREYLIFLNIAAGSACEGRYLVDLSCRLGLLTEANAQPVVVDYTDLAAGLQALIRSLSSKP
jgi:four helix bundle protein